MMAAREIFPWPTAVETIRSEKKFGGEGRQYCVDCQTRYLGGSVALSISCRLPRYLGTCS